MQKRRPAKHKETAYYSASLSPGSGLGLDFAVSRFIGEPLTIEAFKSFFHSLTLGLLADYNIARNRSFVTNSFGLFAPLNHSRTLFIVTHGLTELRISTSNLVISPGAQFMLFESPHN
jgi:hypothetical protein